MAITKDPKNRADSAHDMIREEADHIAAQQVAEHGSLQEARVTDKDYIRGKIDGLRQAADLLGEGG